MSALLQGLSIPDGNPRTINIYRDGVWCDAYTTENGKAVEVPPHGRLIDADEFLKRAIGTKCFRGDYALLLEELVGESTTIIQAEEE